MLANCGIKAFFRRHPPPPSQLPPVTITTRVTPEALRKEKQMRTEGGKPDRYGQDVRSIRGRAGGQLDPRVDFERYREAACKRFIAMARAMGYHAFHDLDDRAKDLYSDFWAYWLERPRSELTGPAVPYIATAMMNKLRAISGRGRSVRPSQLVRAESDVILASIAAEDLDPAEWAIVKEQLWLGSEVVHSLPARERVVFAAVIGRDSRKKTTQPAGYRLAASKLGISETRAKKLSLRANRRIHAAIEQIESGTWCERWTRSIETIAAGGDCEAGFRRHVERCLECRMSVVRLRRQAAIRDSG